MIFYEMLVLLKPESSQELYDQMKNAIELVITEEDRGILKNVDRWGKYLLAYPVDKSSYGVYVLFRFGINDSINKKNVFDKLRSLCILRFNNIVLRYIFVKQGSELNELYCRPDSLADAPQHRTDRVYMNRNNDNASSNIHAEGSI